MSRNATLAEKTFGSLSPEQTRLLERLLDRESQPGRSIKPYPRSAVAGATRTPMSWAQQRLWFIDELEGGGAAYNIQVALRLVGNLNREALRHALDGLVRRHEALRTVFVNADDGPKQEILTDGRFALKELDLVGLADAELEFAVRSNKLEEAQQQFDLRRGPLIRGRLLQLKPDAHVLLITQHHIVSDGWSVAVMLRELRELYAAYRESREAALQPLTIQYADYAQWQREWLQGPVLDKQLSYWRMHLEGAAPELELPTDRPRPVARSYRGKNLGVVLDAQLTADLNSFARRHGLTLFMVLYASWAILLARLSGQQDVVIGTPVANRGRPELEGLIGFFVNTLVLRCHVAGELRLEEFLQQVKEVALGAYDHQDIPFEQIVEVLRPQRSLNRHPIFQVMFALQTAPPTAIRLPDLSATLEDSVNEAAKFDLLLSLEERGEAIRGSLNYDMDLIDRETVERWIDSFQVLLRAVTQDNSCRIDRLPVLPESQRSKVVEEFNAASGVYPQDALIHEQFEEQVRRTPHAVAANCEGQSLSYVQLNERANQLARYLRSRGVVSGELVGICVERGLEMIVGLLGILKAGGAYVPLDPGYPAERVAYMLADAQPRVLLIQSPLRARLSDIAADVIALDQDWHEIARQPSDNLDASSLGLNARNLAYVIYTSGSTGRPKGVMVEHRNVSRLFSATAHWFHFGSNDVWTLFHSFAFDFSVWELWGALLHGGRVVVVPYLTARSPQDFYRLVCEEGVTVLNQTPSAFTQLIDAQARNADARHALRVVIFGGEALELRTLRPWVRRNGVQATQLINMYGITETTVHVTYRPPLTEEEIERGRRNLIGKPIPDLRVYLLDSHRQPVPIGVTGEIHVGGAGAAQGYLNRPELTAERFPADPFVQRPSARMYKSGDLGRWHADGTIEYLGRNDHQVKIRGFRIELGEIEAALVRHEDVRDAVVIAREDTPGEKRLVAYVIPQDAAVAPSVEVMRGYLKAALPDHMVPGAFMILDHLPLTANGKLDQRALPAPGFEAFATQRYEAPQGELEEILAGIWRSLLRVERVGRQDNFFELGGHSLLIVQMMERLRSTGLSVEVRRVFESPTLSELAAVLAREVVGKSDTPPNLIPADAQAITPQMLPLIELEPEHIERIVRAVPEGAANVQDIYPLAPLQEGILFHHILNDQGGDLYVIPILLAVASRERLDQLIAALQEVVDRHDVLRTAVLWEELPRPVQVVYRKATLSVAEVELEPTHDPLQQVQAWLRPEDQRLNLRQAPLICLRIAAASSGQWYALLQFHHIVDDATSMRILIAEIVARLEGRAQQPAASVPYREHVAKAIAYAQLNDAETFFRRKLGSVDEPTAPFGLADVHGDGSQIMDARLQIEAALAERVRVLARRLCVSAATLFHAAWGLVVAGTSGRDDVVFGSVLLGRLQGGGMQQALGMFINTLPLRLQLRGITAKELVEETQRGLIELLTHEQAPLVVAQRCSGISGAAPLFSALLNFRHNATTSEARWSGAAGIRVVAGLERTNYPMTLSVDDLGDGFMLTAQTDRRIGPQRIIDYLHTGLSSLVQALDEAPETPALSLPILPHSERHQLVELFNATQAPHASAHLVHEMFEEQVVVMPDAVAVIHDERSLTYAELNARANQLARYLRAKGAVADRRVAICIDRSLEMVIGLLGVLKAGAAYVPLDPNYPPDRLQYMMQDAAPQLVLTHSSLRTVVPVTATEVIELDQAQQEIDAYAEANLSATELALTAQNLVYVIYTSGSTGTPKGTAMPHRAMVNLIQWHRDHLPLRAGDRVLQFAALSFDVAFQEIFSTLSLGGSLVLIDEWVRKDAGALLELLSRQAIHRLFVPPLMLQSLAENFDASGQIPRSLQQVITAGEQLRVSPEIVRLFEHLDGCQLHNHYGPTETHVVTALTLAGEPGRWPMLPTIGRPIANSQIYILDRTQQPVPAGVAGEIHIGGANLACGYLNRADLTTARFIRDPFSADPKARLYKTGDLGRWQADGAIEYLGRNDHQVKIRGYRIELGEIEAQLAQHPQVREAAVIAREDVAGHKRLVAYVTRRDDSEPVTEELRAFLGNALPEYMVPSAIVVMDKLPLTPSGKLDRQSLPAPELGGYANSSYDPPQGEVENTLARVWQELLHVDLVGRDDNFFELGGHSLLVLKALPRVNRSLACTLKVKDLYQSPTVRELAKRIVGAAAHDDFVDLLQESALDEEIVPVTGRSCVPARVALLTGGTGFVGRFLLAQLLQDTDLVLHCLVRAESRQHAASRLQATLEQWDLWRDEFKARIVAIPGDLRLPRLGIDELTYRSLADSVDSIYHCATSMNHLETYTMAKAANVDAAKELLKLATSSKPKVVNYVSTLGVFGPAAGNSARVVNEETSIDFEKHAASNGYVASKWVGEKIFMRASERGIPCNIFRVGLAWADEKQGRYDEAQREYRIFKSCLLSGFGIENYRYGMIPTPVDYVARAIVALARQHHEGLGVFHISSTRQDVADVFERCNEIGATSLELLSFYEWVAAIKRLHQEGQSLPIVPLIEHTFSMDRDSFQAYQQRIRAGYVRFDCARTHRQLERADISAPSLNDALLRACVHSMYARDPQLLQEERLLPKGQVSGGRRSRGSW